jgi:hypothetical protein
LFPNYPPSIVRVLKSKRLRWPGHVARMEEGRSAFKILTGTPAGRRSLGRSRRRWGDNIKMNFNKWVLIRVRLIRLKIGIIGGLL